MLNDQIVTELVVCTPPTIYFLTEMSMALITCPECKKKISDSADKCPNCGFQLSLEAIAEIKAKDQKNKQASGIGCLALIGIVFVVGFLADDDQKTTDIKSVPNSVEQQANENLSPKIILWKKTDFPYHAKEMVRVVRQSEKELQLAIETNDPRGLQKYVINPVNKEFDTWQGQCDAQYPDLNADRINCIQCQLAASSFRGFAFTYKQEDDVENRKSRELYRKQYVEFLASCSKIH